MDNIKNEEEFLKVKQELEDSLSNLHIRTKQIKSINSRVRRLRIGNKRLFLFIDKYIWCIAFLPRKNCYNPITIKVMKKLIKRLKTEGL